MIHRLLSVTLVLMASGLTALAAGTTYDFKDPKGVNSVSFTLDSLVEPIMGTASGVAGTLFFDPAKPEALTGVITVDVPSMRFPNDRMTAHAKSDEWLKAEEFPTLSYKVDKVINAAKVGDGTWLLHAMGVFRCMDKSFDLPVELRITHLPGQAGVRVKDAKGDLLVVRSTFTVPLAKVGLPSSAKVAENAEIRVAITGMAK